MSHSSLAAVAVIDDDQIPIAVGPAGKQHGAVRSGGDQGVGIVGDVDAGVEFPGLPVVAPPPCP